jgi:hypothetical protein
MDIRSGRDEVAAAKLHQLRHPRCGGSGHRRERGCRRRSTFAAGCNDNDTSLLGAFDAHVIRAVQTVPAAYTDADKNVSRGCEQSLQLAGRTVANQEA